MRNKWFRELFRRRIFIVLLLALQLGFILYLILSTSKLSFWLAFALTFLSFCAVLYVASKKDKGSYKLIWVIMIMGLPIVGGVLYIWFNFQRSIKKYNKRCDEIEENSREMLLLNGNILENACRAAPNAAPQIKYLQEYIGFPVCINTKTTYLSPGEVKFEYLLRELEKAEKYIFLEYFIIQEGKMWNTILEILERKAAEGLDVRILYDDVGCFWLLPKDYTKALEKKGIRAYVFNPFKPILTSIQNNRDHRKIASIDGKVAFTGGINLADEYINEHKRLGVWKDASVMLEGDGAWNLTIMFLQMWELISNENEDFRKFYPQKSSIETDGLVLPYGDRPMDDENVGEQVYMQMITNAKKYLYINTPYLIIDDSMVDALTLAAKSGVDVRLVTPHIGDNRFIHATTRSYYYELVKSGVKVYEYGDGFIHSKTFLSDDLVATVGTTNLDFRSLYLHFECGVWFYKSSVVKDLYADYMKTLERCIPITLDDCKKIKPLQTFFRRILRLFAPLM